MECNKDEASRAREIAEKKFMEKDIIGAKKFALKAHILYPGLDGILQMLETLNVYISAENRLNGEMDWYGVLNVNPMDDHESIRKQYRKLALMFHPDKNKSVGAEGAFKIISEAWNFLSERSKRAAYDKRRNSKVLSHKSPISNTRSSVPANGSSNFTNRTAPTNVKLHKSVPKPPPVPVPKPKHQFSNSSAKVHDPKPDTFWTICHACKMQYEYLRVYVNHNLLCPNCHQAFRAFETTPPLTKSAKRTTWNSAQKQPKNRQSEAPSPGPNSSKSAKEWLFYQGPGSSGHDSRVNMINSEKFKTRNSNFGQESSNLHEKYSYNQMGSFSKASTSGQHLHGVTGRDEGEGDAAAKRDRELKRNIHTSVKEGSVFYESQGDAKRPKYTGEFGSENNDRIIMIQTDITKSSGLSSITTQAMPKVLMEKARKHIYKKLEEWKAEALVRRPAKEYKITYKLQKDGLQGKNNPFVNTCSNVIHVEKPHGIDSDMNTFESMSIDVPDAEFYDFYKCRSETCFEKNQVWAVYDDVDGMPRNYVLIHNIVSVVPFEVTIRWLNSMTYSGSGSINWMGSGFLNTYGAFRFGRSKFKMSLNSFSHKVKWSKSPSGVVFIHPRKGDVWVLYRNWSAYWNELTAYEVIHKYDVVEVLEDYDEESGVVVTPLVKVSGFKTVFHQHLDPNQIRVIPKEDIFQFSHQVPSHLLTGQEAVTAPKGCRELDPAATPSDLLQVISDYREEETAGSDVIGRRNDNIIHLEEDKVEMVETSKTNLIKSADRHKNSSKIGETFDVLTDPCKIN